MENNQFLHFLISGVYSSGKSFLLNNIIGNNLYLLETGRDETTNHAFIVRNNRNYIKLYEAHLIKNRYEYFFEKGKNLANGKEQVISKIKDINSNWKNFSYFIIETPIQIFDEINIKQEIINGIEFIDYPGLDTKKAMIGGYSNNSLFNIINGFFLLNEPKEIGVNGVKEVSSNIIQHFIFGDSGFDGIENCLFLFTKNNNNEQSDFYELDIKKIILSLIEDIKSNMNMTEIHDLNKKLNDSSIKFAKFSNIDYKNYVDKAYKLSSFKNFISYLVGANIKKIKKKNNPENLFQIIDEYIEAKFSLKNEEKKSFSVPLES